LVGKTVAFSELVLTGRVRCEVFGIHLQEGTAATSVCRSQPG
jgi:hypothetical protein